MDGEGDGPDQWLPVNLKAAREDAGLSQYALAQQMRGKGYRFHQQTIERIESAHRPVRVGEAVALAELTRISLQALLSPPVLLRDELALQEAIGRFWQAMAQARYAAEIHAETRAALETLITSLRGGGHADALAGLLAEAERILKDY
jgi:transcriptional regulator with XRE-family HTH domain